MNEKSKKDSKIDTETRISMMINMLRGTDVTGIEIDGVKLTRDPYFDQRTAKISTAKQTESNYKKAFNDMSYWNGIHNPDAENV